MKTEAPGLTSEQQSAKAAILAECDKLKAEGITYVAVHFDGYADESTIEDVKCYRSDWYSHGDVAPAKYDISYLQEPFEQLVPLGYEIDSGGFGDVVLDVDERTITIERNDRFEDYTTNTYEV